MAPAAHVQGRAWVLPLEGRRRTWARPRRGLSVGAWASSRRESLAHLAAGLLAAPAATAAWTAAAAAEPLAALPLPLPASSSSSATASTAAAASRPLQPVVAQPNYAAPGPFRPARLPTLEHLCTRCFPQCTADRCLLRINVVYPKGGPSVGGWRRRLPHSSPAGLPAPAAALS